MRSSLSLVAAAALVVGTGAPARAYEVAWRDVSDFPGDGQTLVVDQADGDVLAMTSPFQERQVVRRLDGRTGAVEWTADVTGDATSIVVDPTDGTSQPNGLLIDPVRGRVNVAGTSRRPDRDRGARQDLVLLAYDTSGPLRWERERPGAVFPSYLEVALDAERGRIHVLGRAGHHPAADAALLLRHPRSLEVRPELARPEQHLRELGGSDAEG